MMHQLSLYPVGKWKYDTLPWQGEKRFNITDSRYPMDGGCLYYASLSVKCLMI